jgi:hypothetical protein
VERGPSKLHHVAELNLTKRRIPDVTVCVAQATMQMAKVLRSSVSGSGILQSGIALSPDAGSEAARDQDVLSYQTTLMA